MKKQSAAPARAVKAPYWLEIENSDRPDRPEIVVGPKDRCWWIVLDSQTKCTLFLLQSLKTIKRPTQFRPSFGQGWSSSGDQRPLCGALAAACRLDSCQRFAGDKHKAEQNNKYHQPRLFKGISSAGKSASALLKVWNNVVLHGPARMCSSARLVCLEGSWRSWSVCLCVCA